MAGHVSTRSIRSRELFHFSLLRTALTSPRQTSSFQHQLNLSGKHSANLHLLLTLHLSISHVCQLIKENY